MIFNFRWIFRRFFTVSIFMQQRKERDLYRRIDWKMWK